jgi:hypothetical protein
MRLRAALMMALLPLLLMLLALMGIGEGQPPGLRSIIDLQVQRSSQSVWFRPAAGEPLKLELINLNPQVNAWFLLNVSGGKARPASFYHLENTDPAHQGLSLDPTQPGRLLIGPLGGPALDARAATRSCQLWPGDALQAARLAKLVYAPLCEGRLLLRNPVRGRRSALEAGSEFLRDHVWGGEQIVGFVKREFYQDVFAERAEPASQAQTSAAAATALRLAGPAGAPPPASMSAAFSKTPPLLAASGLGLSLGSRGLLQAGHWYAPVGSAGVFVSLAYPALLLPPKPALSLDAIEAEATSYLVAFDLADMALGFALGTEHPRLNWSARASSEQVASRPGGPDGIADAQPLVRTGMLGPQLQGLVIASFTGGFKREHGAFRHGALAQVNRASHYGFIEQGVVFSSLVPGLATLYVLSDGTLGMKTWQLADAAALLPHIRHARQNGVALLEPGKAGVQVGALVGRWGAGNWSGSASEKQRTLRAGACLLETGGRRFLVYGYFSTATPAAMAHVFNAYGCQYAMHLDMNALEHTYLALYPRHGEHIVVEHLVQGMRVLDRAQGELLLPRFIGLADDRDFFYLLRREAPR